MSKVDETLEDRGNNYGEYKDQAALSQQIKRVFRDAASYPDLLTYQRESLDMIANKLARILNGNPAYADSWHDIAGYATLVVTELNKPTEVNEGEPGAGYVDQD